LFSRRQHEEGQKEHVVLLTPVKASGTRNQVCNKSSERGRPSSGGGAVWPLCCAAFKPPRTRGIAPVPQGKGVARPAIYLHLLTSYRIVCARVFPGF
jgi:hypothetical protein